MPARRRAATRTKLRRSFRISNVAPQHGRLTGQLRPRQLREPWLALRRRTCSHGRLDPARSQRRSKCGHCPPGHLHTNDSCEDWRGALYNLQAAIWETRPPWTTIMTATSALPHQDRRDLGVEKQKERDGARHPFRRAWQVSLRSAGEAILEAGEREFV